MVEVLALLELVVEQPSVVQQHAIEQPVEFVGVDPMWSFDHLDRVGFRPARRLAARLLTAPHLRHFRTHASETVPDICLPSPMRASRPCAYRPHRRHWSFAPTLKAAAWTNLSMRRSRERVSHRAGSGPLGSSPKGSAYGLTYVNNGKQEQNAAEGNGVRVK
jgi:hypothetical protein